MKPTEEEKKKKKKHHNKGEKVVNAIKHILPHHHHSDHDEQSTAVTPSSSKVIPPTSISIVENEPSSKVHRHQAPFNKDNDHLSKHHRKKRTKASDAKTLKPTVPVRTREVAPPSSPTSTTTDPLTADILSITDTLPTRSPEMTRSPTTPELLSAISPEAVVIDSAPTSAPATTFAPKAKTWLERLDLLLANIIPQYSRWRRMFTDHIVRPHDATCQQAVDALDAVLHAIQSKAPAVNEALSSAGRVIRFTGQSGSAPSVNIAPVVKDSPKPPNTPLLK